MAKKKKTGYDRESQLGGAYVLDIARNKSFYNAHEGKFLDEEEIYKDEMKKKKAKK